MLGVIRNQLVSKADQLMQIMCSCDTFDDDTISVKKSTFVVI